MLKRDEAVRALTIELQNAYPRARISWLAYAEDFGTLAITPYPGELEQVINVDWSRYDDVDALVDDVLGEVA